MTPLMLTVAKGTREGPISIEVDAFNDGFRLRNTTDDVEPSRGEYIRADERLRAANLRLAVRPRGAGYAEGHCHGEQADQCTRRRSGAHYRFH